MEKRIFSSWNRSNLSQINGSFSKKQSKLYNDHKTKILELNDTSLFLKDFKEGDIFINDSLHNTLNKILKHGPDIFYKGEIANKIVNYGHIL